MVLHDHDVGGTARELNLKKQLLREDILRSFEFPSETITSTQSVRWLCFGAVPFVFDVAHQV